MSVYLRCAVYFIEKMGLGVVAHAFNPSTWEAEAGEFLSLRPAWSTE
jgi:major histocompatibility complex class I